MEIWVAVTFAAAAFQTVRFMLQKQLSAGKLSVMGATFARFLYSAPFLPIILLGYLHLTGQSLPEVGWRFWPNVLIGAFAQVIATLCVVAVFKMRNFAVGITLMKTEVVATAIMALVVLGEVITPLGGAAILVGLVGVLLLTETPEIAGGWIKRSWNRAAGLGLASGVIFSISSVGYRGATIEVASEEAFVRGVMTLTAVVWSQVLGMALWMAASKPAEIGRVLRAWRTAGWIGLTSMAGSMCWFTAFALQKVALVKAVGQVELIFSLLASVWFFRERIRVKEAIGIALLSGSVLSLVLFL
ncbi:MAG TPA: hypothetical protein DEF12_02960 [Rhodobacteraceae bacterium]|jgi:drug/metabolite transporter (DMT)-like permease|nr:hypothetical protein [Paracoccaceae bacterium]HBV53977.1 hypothetical protein [Paracoccaceae bacterium]